MLCCGVPQDAIQRPFEGGDPCARDRLIALLRRLTIRATKEDLTMLVKCHRKARLTHLTLAGMTPAGSCAWNVLSLQMGMACSHGEVLQLKAYDIA